MFENLKVVELASVLAGPAVGMFLAELGATVIKVENKVTGGDVTRSWKLPTEDEDTDISSYFSSVNWGKKSIAIDATQDGGRQVIYELVKKADIVIASYKPGDDIKLRLDYNTLSYINPRLIYGHVTGYGKDDQRAGYDAIVQAASGFTYMNGSPDSKPTKMPVALIDLLAAHQLKEAVLLGLIRRAETGEGSYIHTSLLQSGIASLANQASNWLVGGKIPERIGSDHPNIVPYGNTFKTSDDKEIVLGVGNDQQFKKLCQVIGRPELAVLPVYATNRNRVQNRDKLNRLLSEQISKFDRETLISGLGEAGVPTGGILNMKEVFEQPAGQEMIVRDSEESENGKRLTGVRTIAFKSNSMNFAQELSAPPQLSEHRDEILKDILGYYDEKISRLTENGSIL